MTGSRTCIWSSSVSIGCTLLPWSTWPVTTLSTTWPCVYGKGKFELEEQESIEEAALTLATPDEVSLTP